MTALASLPELYLPRKQVPTQRDRDIFLATVAGDRTQKEVAAEFGVSQPRVAQIVQKVQEWTDEATASVRLAQPPQAEAEGQTGQETRPTEEGDESADLDNPWTNPDFTPEQRLRLAEFLVYERLEFVYGRSLAGWRKSLEDERQNVLRHVGDNVIREERTKTQCGRVGFLNQAQRATLALGRLAGVDVTGKAARKLVEQERASAEPCRTAVEPPLEETTTDQETRPTEKQADVFAPPPAEATVELPEARRAQAQSESGSPLSTPQLARTPYNRDPRQRRAQNAALQRRAAFLGGTDGRLSPSYVEDSISRK